LRNCDGDTEEQGWKKSSSVKCDVDAEDQKKVYVSWHRMYND